MLTLPKHAYSTRLKSSKHPKMSASDTKNNNINATLIINDIQHLKNVTFSIMALNNNTHNKDKKRQYT